MISNASISGPAPARACGGQEPEAEYRLGDRRYTLWPAAGPDAAGQALEITCYARITGGGFAALAYDLAGKCWHVAVLDLDAGSAVAVSLVVGLVVVGPGARPRPGGRSRPTTAAAPGTSTTAAPGPGPGHDRGPRGAELHHRGPRGQIVGLMVAAGWSTSASSSAWCRAGLRPAAG